MTHAAQFLSEAKQVIDGLDVDAIERMAFLLEQARERGGRLFILGVGGTAANAVSAAAAVSVTMAADRHRRNASADCTVSDRFVMSCPS